MPTLTTRTAASSADHHKKKLLHRLFNVKQFLFDLSPGYKVSGIAAGESAMV